jgi:valyl-tRNA synthetase
MMGYNALWVPGTDHASIATEARVVRMLREQGHTKASLGRERFLEKAFEWKDKYGGIIIQQLKRLGASCDWQRERFTMEPALSQSVLAVFVRLHEEGLIYRGLRMVNWDPEGQTALSDEEVIHREVDSALYSVRYELVERPGQYLTIATTRPETLMADTAICVHPDDERYRELVGLHVRVPVVGRQIPIIADEYVDREFGTGCLKVTPAHDPNDYALGQKHKLPVIDILQPNGHLIEDTALVGPYAGMDRFAARKQVAIDLKAIGTITDVKSIRNSVGHSERTDAVVEPRLSLQWWVRMEPLAELALAAVNDGRVRLIPERFNNTYRHWLENVQDWCISRQLWWGQRIPAYYLPDGQIVVALTPEAALEKARALGFDGPADALRQDDDVLDTWFSSWLWPLSVFDHDFVNPDAPRNPDVQYYYPTNDLVTAPEILFFWVARMIMAGLKFHGEVPFRNVYLTGIVRDSQRRKMSKSLGNSPDPLDLIVQYGADGVRMGILLAAPAGNDLLFDESYCEQGRNFANKIWNASRLLMLLGQQAQEPQLRDEPTVAERLATQWMEARLREGAQEIELLYAQFKISDALMTLYKLVWDDFCSWYLELIKPPFGPDGSPIAPLSNATHQAALAIWGQLLQLLHPIMPFITEEIWHQLWPTRSATDFITTSPLRIPDPEPTDVDLLREMAQIREIVTALRAFRNDKQLSQRQPLSLHYLTDAAGTALFDKYSTVLYGQADLDLLKRVDAAPSGALPLAVRHHQLFIPLAGLVDVEAERQKLLAELEYTLGFLESVNKKLSNERFVANAKPAVVDNERKKQADADARIAALQAQLAALG